MIKLFHLILFLKLRRINENFEILLKRVMCIKLKGIFYNTELSLK